MRIDQAREDGPRGNSPTARWTCPHNASTQHAKLAGCVTTRWFHPEEPGTKSLNPLLVHRDIEPARATKHEAEHPRSDVRPLEFRRFGCFYYSMKNTETRFTTSEVVPVESNVRRKRHPVASSSLRP